MDCGNPPFMSRALRLALLEPSGGGIPPGSNPFWKGLVYNLASETPPFCAILTGVKVFIEPPCVCGLQS